MKPRIHKHDINIIIWSFAQVAKDSQAQFKHYHMNHDNMMHSIVREFLKCIK
jgi:hypothetical protein